MSTDDIQENGVCWVCGQTYTLELLKVDKTHREGPYICLDCDDHRQGQGAGA